MTREEFESKRIKACKNYMKKAEEDMKVLNGKIKLSNAKRRYNLAKSFLEEWDKNGFWTSKNESAYLMLYKDVKTDDNISAF